MTLEGHVENGQIVLDQLRVLPDGVRVRVEVVDQPVQSPEADVQPSDQPPTLLERMKSFVGSAKGLPPDYAINHTRRYRGSE